MPKKIEDDIIRQDFLKFINIQPEGYKWSITSLCEGKIFPTSYLMYKRLAIIDKNKESALKKYLGDNVFSDVMKRTNFIKAYPVWTENRLRNDLKSWLDKQPVGTWTWSDLLKDPECQNLCYGLQKHYTYNLHEKTIEWYGVEFVKEHCFTKRNWIYSKDEIAQFIEDFISEIDKKKKKFWTINDLNTWTYRGSPGFGHSLYQYLRKKHRIISEKTIEDYIGKNHKCTLQRKLIFWRESKIKNVLTDFVMKWNKKRRWTPMDLFRSGGEARKLYRILAKERGFDSAYFKSLLGDHLWKSKPGKIQRRVFTKDFIKNELISFLKNLPSKKSWSTMDLMKHKRDGYGRSYLWRWIHVNYGGVDTKSISDILGDQKNLLDDKPWVWKVKRSRMAA